MEKARIAVMVSGGGTNLQALIDAQISGIIKSGEICLVLSNSHSAYALERAKNAGIKTFSVTKKECGSQDAFEKALIEELEKETIDLIVLAGFLSILSKNFTDRFSKRIINILVD